MSFQDIIHGLDAAGLPPPPAPPPLRTVVSHAVFQINTKSAALWHLADALASGRGAARAIRESIRRTRAEATRLARNTARKLAGAGAGGDDAAATEIIGPKLAADFEAALRDLQRAQQRVITADRQETASSSAAFLSPFFSPPAPPGTTSYASPSRTGPYNGTWDDHHQSNVQTQQPQEQQLGESRRTQELVRLESEVTFNEALVQEREQEIVKIQQEITEINEIFRDLATLVHGQHQAIDVVESNLSSAASATRKAEVELRKAAAAQKTSSETSCLLQTAAGLVVLILILVFTLF